MVQAREKSFVFICLGHKGVHLLLERSCTRMPSVLVQAPESARLVPSVAAAMRPGPLKATRSPIAAVLKNLPRLLQSQLVSKLATSQGVTMAQTVAIERIDHIGIRIRNLDCTLAFYAVLGFALVRRAEGDDVAIIRNQHGVELNLVFNANAGDPTANILMDVPDKLPGYTHIALRVASIPATIVALEANNIPITQGPVSFGESGHVSVFVRDPDRNVIELRGRKQRVVEGVTRYVP